MSVLSVAWLFIRTLFGASISKALDLAGRVPWKVWAAVVVVTFAGIYHAHAVSAAHAAGEGAGRAAVQTTLEAEMHTSEALRSDLLDAWTASADAEGRDFAHTNALNACIGTRQMMDTITGAVMAHREQQRAAAVRALNTTQLELDHAYEITGDRCALQPVPAAVLRVLDGAAFGASGSDSDAGREGASATTRPRLVCVDGTNTCASAPSATTAYRDLADWITNGWAPALRACNADKAAIAALDPGNDTGMAGHVAATQHETSIQ